MRAGPSSIRAVEWLCERTGHAPTQGAKGVMVLDTKGRIRGAVIFDRWTENSAEAHMAAETPMAWRILAPAAFEYVFTQCGRGVVFGPVCESNEKAVKLTHRLGFTLEHWLKNVYAPGVGMLLFVMTREACRWISPQRRAA